MSKRTELLAGSGYCRIASGIGPHPVFAPEKGSGGGGGDVAEAVTHDDIEEVTKQLGAISDQVKNFAEDVTKKMNTGAELNKELKEKADTALKEQGELRARIQDMEQRVAKIGEGGALVSPREYLTPGRRFSADEKVKEFLENRPTRGRVRVDMPNVTQEHAVSTITTGSAGPASLVLPQRIPGFIPIPQRRFVVRDLITPGRTSQNAVQFVVETGFTNSAKVVSEGITKPQSDVKFDLVTKSVATIAHWMLASKQILDDLPMLESHIDGRLRYGLAFVEEDQLLNGDGTGNNLLGIIPQASAYSAAFAPALPTAIDVVRLAILQSELALFPATGIVLHPTDWAKIELTKSTIGEYIFAIPTSMAGEHLWSRPVVPTMAMTANHFLVGAFQLGAQIFDREDANVELSTEDSDNFRKNLVTLRAEERLVLAVYRPQAFITGTFS